MNSAAGRELMLVDVNVLRPLDEEASAVLVVSFRVLVWMVAEVAEQATVDTAREAIELALNSV